MSGTVSALAALAASAVQLAALGGVHCFQAPAACTEWHAHWVPCPAWGWADGVCQTWLLARAAQLPRAWQQPPRLHPPCPGLHTALTLRSPPHSPCAVANLGEGNPANEEIDFMLALIGLREMAADGVADASRQAAHLEAMQV